MFGSRLTQSAQPVTKPKKSRLLSADQLCRLRRPQGPLSVPVAGGLACSHQCFGEGWIMKRVGCVLCALAASVMVIASVSGAFARALIAIPLQGQSAQQQENDRGACGDYAAQVSGYSPSGLPMIVRAGPPGVISGPVPTPPIMVQTAQGTRGDVGTSACRLDRRHHKPPTACHARRALCQLSRRRRGVPYGARLPSPDERPRAIRRGQCET